MKNKFVLFHTSLSIVALLTWAATAHAGLLRLESNTLSSLRNGEDLKSEVPLYEYLEASYGSANRSFEANANFSYFVDPKRSGSSTFNLYVLDASYRLIPRILKVKAGRSFNVESTIRTTVTDSGALELTLFNDLLRLGGLAGYERTRELDTFKSRAKIAAGYLNVRSSSATPLVFNAKYQVRKYTDVAKPNEYLIEGALTKTFDTIWTPEALINSEFNLGDYHNRLVEGGFDLHPSSALSFRVRGTTYYVKPSEGLETPLYAIFAQGRLYEGMAQVDYRMSPEFTAGVAVAHDDYALANNTRTNGNKFTVSARFQKSWFSVLNAVYGFKSYGGNAYGDQLKFEQRVSDRLAFYENGEATHYEKITSSKRWALSSQAGVQYWVSNPLKVTVGGELNSNNYLRYDARVIAKLTYSLWSEI